MAQTGNWKSDSSAGKSESTFKRCKRPTNHKKVSVFEDGDSNFEMPVEGGVQKCSDSLGSPQPPNLAHPAPTRLPLKVVLLVILILMSMLL